MQLDEPWKQDVVCQVMRGEDATAQGYDSYYDCLWCVWSDSEYIYNTCENTTHALTPLQTAISECIPWLRNYTYYTEGNYDAITIYTKQDADARLTPLPPSLQQHPRRVKEIRVFNTPNIMSDLPVDAWPVLHLLSDTNAVELPLWTPVGSAVVKVDDAVDTGTHPFVVDTVTGDTYYFSQCLIQFVFD